MPNPDSINNTHSKKGLIITVVIIAVIAVAGYVVARTGSKKSASQDQSVGRGTTVDTTGVQRNANEEVQAPPPDNTPPPPTEIFSYTGEVVSVGDKQLTMLAKPGVNAIAKEITLTIVADSSTQIIRRTMPKVLPKGDGPLQLKQDNITLNDIKKGDMVAVMSTVNVIDKNAFTASQIFLLASE